MVSKKASILLGLMAMVALISSVVGARNLAETKKGYDGGGACTTSNCFLLPGFGLPGLPGLGMPGLPGFPGMGIPVLPGFGGGGGGPRNAEALKKQNDVGDVKTDKNGGHEGWGEGGLAGWPASAPESGGP